MHFVPMALGAWYHLPREKGVAYAAQESWVQNNTVKVLPTSCFGMRLLTPYQDNILFGSPYDEERYKKVLHQCGLERDLALFKAGDETEVGEKGLTLSGGQKARITLARYVFQPFVRTSKTEAYLMNRAMYSLAEILLLDDVLAALEYVSIWSMVGSSLLCSLQSSVHTSKWIVDKCLSGDLARGRTIILVV